MFEFLKIQYGFGKISKEILKMLVPKRITAEQYTEITGEDYVE